MKRCETVQPEGDSDVGWRANTHKYIVVSHLPLKPP